MLLQIETTHHPATDLGYLLHKNPAKLQSFDLSFGKVHVFYPIATEDRCQVAVLLDVDPVGLVRGRRGPSGNNRSLEFARPGTVVVTTPNREYNVMWETLPAGTFRHRDHRFEWTRAEFRAWAERVAASFGYTVRFLPVGPVDDAVGSPTQMGVFQS